jgi:unsaturated rhamnogalacturonyl hydrolase
MRPGSLLGCVLLYAAVAAAQVVAVDAFHNNETKLPGHYRWDDAQMGGFSQLGKLLEGMGAQLRTIRTRVTSDALNGVSVFIIVDPDTPAESRAPQYIETDEIRAIEAWVRGGGRLVLFGNDKGNAEFQHLNQLAGRFGIEFLEETYPRVKGKGILTVASENAVVGKGLTAYLVEVSPLRLEAGAQVLLSDNGTPLMALVSAGKGEVLALGDPWIYNEYIDHKDNRRMAENVFRHLLAK